MIDLPTKSSGTFEAEGRLIGPMDLLIAAIVVSTSGILVTNNVREFERVPRLNFENWKEA